MEDSSPDSLGPLITEAAAQLAALAPPAPLDAYRTIVHDIDRAVAGGVVGYWQWPAPVESALAWGRDDRALSGELLHAHQVAVLLTQIASLQERLARHQLPTPFREEYRRTLRRVLDRIRAGTPWRCGAADDVFRKDIALLSLRLVPCASHVVSRWSGVPGRLLISPPNLVSGASAKVLLQLHGHRRPLLENHVHPEMLDRFDAAGRLRCYELVCALLQHWPEARGLMGTSWYYDPAVGTVSPRLSYLHDVPAAHGALFLDAGAPEDARGNAVARSETRRRLVAEGRYRPRHVTMVWSRARLLGSPWGGASIR